MVSTDLDLTQAKNLRAYAEQLLSDKTVLKETDVDSLTKNEVVSLVHELQVHQIELEIQNDELLHTQEELEASKTKYFELYNIAPVGYLTINNNGLITESNLTFSNSIGFPRHDINGKPFTKFVLAADQDIYYKHKKHLLDSSNMHVCELRMVTRDGRLFWARMEATKEYNNSLNAFDYFCAISDITAKKHHEQLLVEQYRLLQALINSPLDLIFSLDREYRYTAFNKHYSDEMRKIWQAEIKIGDRILDFMTVQEAAKAKYNIDKVLKGEWIVDVIHHQDLNVYHEIDWNPIYDDKSEVVGLTAFVRDITDRKLADEIIKDNNVYLEQKVKERTNELEVSKYELEAFSSSVARDLSNSLHTIDGFSQILQEDYVEVLDLEAMGLLQVIRHNTKKMDGFIKALLHLARITQKEKNLVPIVMKTIVHDIWEEMMPATKNSVVFVLSDIPDAMGDIRLIKTLWQHLLSNAVKFSRNQPVKKITVSGEIKGDLVEYCITDTGIGFDMKNYDKLFQIFQRLHTEHEYDGAGIGLSLAQRIVKMHGGQIWATGEVGKGASFYFSLPVVD